MFRRRRRATERRLAWSYGWCRDAYGVFWGFVRRVMVVGPVRLVSYRDSAG